LWALKENGLRYFVFPLKNTRHLLATYSDPIWVEPGLWAIPVFAETYGKSWEAIQRQLDLTLQRMPKRGHLTLLGHPFFDGSNVRLPILEKTVEYLKSAGFQGISLSQTIANPPTTSKKTLRLRPFGASGPKGVAERISNKWFCSRYSSFTTKPKVECK
jgi:hypothetical protein